MVDKPGIEVLAKQADIAIHVITANATANETSFSFAVPSHPTAPAACYRVTDLFTGAQLDSGKLDSAPKFVDCLDPYGVRGYTITYR